ncbi:MAG TPA: hypothetical protein VE860_25025 [Chthoniobacterales bacterium]|jgi:hypothetical protein|nr:hypothetical protein [Chthoniobacterales bacterium]
MFQVIRQIDQAREPLLCKLPGGGLQQRLEIGVAKYLYPVFATFL